MPDAGGEITPGLEKTIAEEIQRVQMESYGEGANDIQVWVHENVIFVMLDLDITQAERTLLEAGRGDAVEETREAYQQAIGPVFTAIVERATGRRVASFVSKMSVDPLYSIEVFRLAPAVR